MVDAAVEHGIAPLLYVSLRETGRLEAQAPQVRAALGRVAREAMLVEPVLDEDMHRVLDALAAEGIRPLVFKGAALAHTHYAEPWLRPRVDVDLLIRRDEAPRAANILERLGYARATRPTGDHVTHQFTYLGASGGVPTAYDVHWRIADPQAFADTFSFDELDAASAPLPGTQTARTLSDVHALLVACMHRVAHHYDADSLILVCDIDRLARRFTIADWDRFVALAAAKRIRAVSARGLALAHSCFATPVPPHVHTALGAADDEPSAAYLRQHLRKIDILRSDLRQLGSWRARLKLLREHLFPSPAYLLASSGSTRRSFVPALYLLRIVRGASAWFRPLR